MAIIDSIVIYIVKIQKQTFIVTEESLAEHIHFKYLQKQKQKNHKNKDSSTEAGAIPLFQNRDFFFFLF